MFLPSPQVKLEMAFSWLLSQLVTAKGWTDADGQGFSHQAEAIDAYRQEDLLQRVGQLAYSLYAVGLGSISSCCVWKSTRSFIEQIVRAEPEYDFSTAKLGNMKACINDVRRPGASS